MSDNDVLISARGLSVGFRIGGTGNITEKNRKWRLEKNPQSIGSGVFIGKHIGSTT